MKDVANDDMASKAKPEHAMESGSSEAFDPRRMGELDRQEKKEYIFIGTHTVESGDTLSGLAKKYYGSEAKAYWMEIYEANKGIIGDNPNVILVGQVLNIPEKPIL